MREAVTERLEEYRRQLAKFPIQRGAVSEVFLEHSGALDEAQLLYLHVYAPVITAFTEWVIGEACRAGQKRLYFLARDAYPMYEAAKRLCAARGLSIECRYLKVSRRCVRLPEYWLLKERCVERICVGGIDVTLGMILRRAGLTGQEAGETAACLDCEEARALSYREIMELKGKLLRIPCFLQYTYAHSKAAYADTIGYFAQEGLFDPIPYAVVDSGWTGTIQQSIQNLLRTRQSDRTVEGYYFGLYELPRGADAKYYHAFYFGPRGGMKRKIYFSNCLFETVCSSAECMTTGYRRENGRFVPIQGGRRNPNAVLLQKNEEVLFLYLQSYLRMCEGRGGRGNRSGEHHVGADGAREKKCGSDRAHSVQEGECRNRGREHHTGADAHGEKSAGAALCEQLLTRAMARPEKWEVKAYGDCLFSDDMLEETVQNVAARFDENDVKKQRLTYRIPVMLGLREGTVKESAWIEGSLVRCRVDGKAALHRAAVYKRMIYIKKALLRKRI
ncbi:MAG: hypothetical protein NC409_06405 [Clostridium sp.]|nr:hypothetical protein [Clostridium sp.]